MANYIGKRTRVEFNGHDVSHLTGVSIGGMNKVFDTFQTLKDPFDHDIEISDEASGSFDIVASDKSGDQRFKEMMNLVLGYQDLDYTSTPTTDSISVADENFDATNEVNYTVPRNIPSFTRLGDGDSLIEFDSVSEAVWFKIVALGETIENLAIPFQTSGGTSAGMEVHLYIDNSGAPHGSTLANSGNAAAIGFTLAHADYSSAATGGNGWRWANLTVPATWTNLTIGDTYWVRVKFDTENGGTVDPEIRTRTYPLSNNGLTYNNTSTSVPGSSTDPQVDVIHYIKYKTTEGLKVVVYDYIDLAETSGVKWTFNKVILDSVTPSFANKQATRASISWRCSEWTFDSI